MVMPKSSGLLFQATLSRVVIFLALIVFSAHQAFCQSEEDEVTRLRYEVKVLKETVRISEENNSKMEERLRAIEQMVQTKKAKAPAAAGTAAAAARPVVEGETAPQVEQIAEKTAVELLRENQERSAEDSVDILHKIPNYLPNYITKGLEYHGYFRSGYGVNDKGGHMQAFMAPDALAKYRLGNEQETYIETIFLNKNWNPDPEGVTLETQIRVAYQSQQNQTWDPDNQIILREMYGRMGHFCTWDPDIKVWAGQRFLRLPELDINDFWWYDLSGYGGGFEDINVGIGKLDVTFVGFASDDLTLSTSQGRMSKENINVKVGDIDVPFGKGMFWVNGGFMKGGIDTQDLDFKVPDLGGIDVGVMHYIPGDDVNNQFAVQYGNGANTSLSAGANIPSDGDDRKSWRVRITDMYNNQITKKLSMQAVGVYQYTRYGDATKNQETWLSLGVRPIYMVSKHFGLELEPGMDYINNPRDGYDTCLFKLTAGIRITPGMIFNSRPAFRIFATYAKWGDGFKGNPLLGGQGFINQTEGMNYGVQCENWW
jgi:maltoporin